MKTSGIGGQAVIEGIMMRNRDKYSIAVRKPDKEIDVVVREGEMLTEKHKWLNFPIVRGIFNFVDSMVVGIKTINYSASFYDDPAEEEKTKADEIGQSIFKDKFESVLMAVTVIISFAIAIALFMLLPYFVSRLLSGVVASQTLLNFFEGVSRVIIFIIYLLAISKMKDIKRTFMYHGAEHKCINCIEHGMPLTADNVKNSSRFHKRCGTNFLFLVMFISIIFFIFIRVDNVALQLAIRILLVPVVAGVSYEVIRFSGKNDNGVVDVITKPGMALQKITTKEPDMEMIEVGIKAVEAVFDWKAFLKEYYKDSENPYEEIKAKETEMKVSADVILGHEESDNRTISPDEIEEENPIENYYSDGSSNKSGIVIESHFEGIEETEEEKAKNPLFESGLFEADYSTENKTNDNIAVDLSPKNTEEKAVEEKADETVAAPVIDNDDIPTFKSRKDKK